LSRPDGIIFEPAGTALAQVAQAAATASVAWVVLNKTPDYIDEVRKVHQTPVFSISVDHLGVGRTQGQQFGALLPAGGIVLYIQGPSASDASELRTRGMNLTKPDNVEIRMIRGNWTEESAYQAVTSWLRLSTSKQLPLGLVGCQNDVMAIGARKAFYEQANGKERDKFLNLPFTGCDGGPETGQEWVRKGLLAATVVMQPNAGRAVEMMVDAIRTGLQPQPCTLTPTLSYPTIEDLAARSKEMLSAKRLPPK
jgi:ribose transport system substrate-binding protein